jgi:hypothetical protein
VLSVLSVCQQTTISISTEEIIARRIEGIQRMIRIPHCPSIEVSSVELESIVVYCMIQITTIRNG